MMDGRGYFHAYFRGEFVRVPTVGIHATKTCWRSSVAEKVHKLMNAFGIADMEAG